jgi:hypothetical protein
MKIHRCRWESLAITLGLAGGLFGACLPAAAAEVTLTPIADTTIADGVDPGSGEDFTDNSSGACDNLFAGNTNDDFARRALIEFDVAGNVPAGSTINSVTLTVVVNRSGDNQAASMTIAPLTRVFGGA